MARTREFCEDQVLDAAMEVFWENGYEGTSISDLMTATGLAKGSLYKAYGSKHNIFMLALGRYCEIISECHRQSLQSESEPREALFNWYKQTLAFLNNRKNSSRGCLGLNSLIELSDQHPVVKETVSRNQAYVTSLIQAQIETAQQQGSFSTDIDAKDLTMIMALFHTGASVTVGSIFSEKELMELVPKLLALLEVKA